jgi:DNA-binding transcriptional LysR family regulator
VTPGAVSQQIKQLESALSVVLFRKVGREIDLTDVGIQLSRRVAVAFDEIDRAIDDAVDVNVAKRLRLKVTPSLAIRWLVPRLAGFYALHGDIDLEMSTIATPTDARLDGADCAIRHGVGEWNDVEFDHLFDDEFVPVCAPALAEGLHSPGDLLQSNLLHSMLRPEAWELWFGAAGVSMGPRTRGPMLANAALCYQAAAEGLGIAIAQKAYIGDDLKSGRLVIPVNFVGRTEKGYYLVCDPRKADLPVVRLFRNWLRSVR